jgi:hypothetical protein
MNFQELVCSVTQVALGEPGKQKFYPLHAGGYEAYKKALLSQFPNEEEAIDKYVALLKVTCTMYLGQAYVVVPFFHMYYHW